MQHHNIAGDSRTSGLLMKLMTRILYVLMIMLSLHIEISLQKFTSEEIATIISCQGIIGEGSYGRVYRGRGLAIKLLHEVLTMLPSFYAHAVWFITIVFYYAEKSSSFIWHY